LLELIRTEPELGKVVVKPLLPVPVGASVVELPIGNGADVSDTIRVVELSVPGAPEEAVYPVSDGSVVCVELRVGKGAGPGDCVGVVVRLPDPNGAVPDGADPVGPAMLVPLVIGNGAVEVPPVGSTPLSSVPELEVVPETLVDRLLKAVELAGGKGKDAEEIPVVGGNPPVPVEPPVGPAVVVEFPIGNGGELDMVRELGATEEPPGGRDPVAVMLEGGRDPEVGPTAGAEV
jgi:hypothetical protein